MFVCVCAQVYYTIIMINMTWSFWAALKIEFHPNAFSHNYAHRRTGAHFPTLDQIALAGAIIWTEWRWQRVRLKYGNLSENRIGRLRNSPAFGSPSAALARSMASCPDRSASTLASSARSTSSEAVKRRSRTKPYVMPSVRNA